MIGYRENQGVSQLDILNLLILNAIKVIWQFDNQVFSLPITTKSAYEGAFYVKTNNFTLVTFYIFVCTVVKLKGHFILFKR